MKKILDLIADRMKAAFTECGYDEAYAKVVLSNRPDLCEYQCNGAMAAAKAYKKKPIDIANEAVEKLDGNEMFSEISAVMPGFINIRLNPQYLADYMNGMRGEEKLGVEETGHGETVIVDYGGANVAKPLHVGHLRSAVIGESIKRMGAFLGYHMIGDVHLGDWGLQMGLISRNYGTENRSWCILTKLTPGNIQQSRRLPSESWRISTRRQVGKQKRTRRLKSVHRRRPLSSRTDMRRLPLSGTISWQYPLPT